MLHQFLRDLADRLDPPPPKPSFEPVATADAIAELCHPTGDPELDGIHIALIDLVQGGLVKSVRDTEGQLRFSVTPSGKDKIKEILGELGETYDRGNEPREESLYPRVAGGRSMQRREPGNLLR